MNYEELSNIWKDEQKNNSGINLNQSLLKEVSANTITNKLKEIKWESLLEVFVTPLWMLFLINFLLDNSNNLAFIIPAVILLAIAIYGMVFEVRKLNLFYSINNSFSILQTQQKLARLRRLEIIDTNSLYVFIPLFFVPFIIVIAQGFFGINVYELGFSQREILVAIVSTMVIAAIIIFFLKKYPNKQLKNAINFMSELKDIEEDKE